MGMYLAVIHKSAESDYGVSFPDFPGVVTAGRTPDEARALAEEALAFHIGGLIEDEETLPEPSNLELAMEDVINRRGMAILVPVKTEAARSTRVNVSFPADMLEQMDKYVKAHGFSRSRFLVKAAKKAMEDAA